MSCAAPKAQVRRRAGNRRGERIGSEDERIAAEIERILNRQVAPRFRNAIGLPVVEPLPGDRQVLERLRLRRDAAAGHEQLLRFASRSRKALPDVERVLCVRHAVDRAAEQQAVAPVHRVLAGLDVDRHVADVEIREPEGVEPFARWPLGVALRVVAQDTGNGQAVDQRVRRRGIACCRDGYTRCRTSRRRSRESPFAACRRSRTRTARRTGWRRASPCRNCGRRRRSSGCR